MRAPAIKRGKSKLRWKISCCDLKLENAIICFKFAPCVPFCLLYMQSPSYVILPMGRCTQYDFLSKKLKIIREEGFGSIFNSI